MSGSHEHMQRLPLLFSTLFLGALSVLLNNCSSSAEPVASRSGASSGSVASGGTGTGGAATAGNVASTAGSGAASSTTDAGTTDASSTVSGNATTGPFAIGGVGGSFVVSRDQGGSVDACQETGVTFTPDIPTVFILVDRSTSMWDNMYWDDLRDGILDVVQRLHQDVRFGLGTFTGIQGSTCPLDLQSVATIDFNNFQPISDFYTTIQHPGVATETPTAAGLQRAHELLVADNAAFPGPKFILLVTDGNPDYCDSGQVECRADVTVKVLQNLFADAAVPTRTFVVALPDQGIDQDWLRAFANAGAGQPVSAPQDTQYCSAVLPETLALLPGVPTTWPVATYGASMGPEVPYNVDPAQRDQLVAEIAGVIAGVKSCVFDLEGELQIVSGREAEGTVVIQTVDNPTGAAQPYDASGVSGWKVNNGTQIELVGASCDTLRSPDTTGIEFGFPCEIIIPK